MNTRSQAKVNARPAFACIFRNRQGAAAVEFAVAAVVLFMLIFGTIEFVRIGMVRHAVDNASYEAARRIIVLGASVADAERAAQAVLSRNGIVNATVTVSPNPITESTTQVSVNVEAPMNGNEWGPNVYGQGIELSSTTTLHTERPPVLLAKSIPPTPAPEPPSDGDSSPPADPTPAPAPAPPPPQTEGPTDPPAPQPPEPPKPPEPPQPRR